MNRVKGHFPPSFRSPRSTADRNGVGAGSTHKELYLSSGDDFIIGWYFAICPEIALSSSVVFSSGILTLIKITCWFGLLFSKGGQSKPTQVHETPIPSRSVGSAPTPSLSRKLYSPIFFVELSTVSFKLYLCHGLHLLSHSSRMSALSR